VSDGKNIAFRVNAPLVLRSHNVPHLNSAFSRLLAELAQLAFHGGGPVHAVLTVSAPALESILWNLKIQNFLPLILEKFSSGCT
jgi:hypothetical protein